jgi:hypothetical protein
MKNWIPEFDVDLGRIELRRERLLSAHSSSGIPMRSEPAEPFERRDGEWTMVDDSCHL